MYVEPMTGVGTQQMSQPIQPVSQPTAVKTAETQNTESTEGKVKDRSQTADKVAELSGSVESLVRDDTAFQDKLKKILEQVASALPNAEAKFGIHEKTNRITITLVDKETQEVIKEIPPEKSLDLIAKRMELAGVLVDEKL
ncbi:MAG: flagellar protein FlaG [Roseburia sp.]|nr:flagellar protein FlaG [Roseburia sp.]